MDVAPEADPAAVLAQAGEDADRFGLGRAFRRDRQAAFVDRLEIAPIEGDLVRVLSRQYRVGLGAGGDQDAAGTQDVDRVQGDPAGALAHVLQPIEADRPGMAEGVHVDRQRRMAIDDANAFLQSLGHFLVVQGVAGRVDEPLAVGDGDAAPAVEQLANSWRAPFRRGVRPLVADRPAVGQELVGDHRFFLAPAGAHRRFAAFADQALVAGQELLHLDRVIGQRLGRRVDRRQAAADHHHRQAQLHVGDGLGLGSTGQLQGHEEVGGRAHAARQAVGDRQHRRPAGADRERDMVEAHIEGLVQGDGAAEAHAAEHGEMGAALQEQADDLEEGLVPAHGDAVFGDAAEAGHDPLVQGLAQRVPVADGQERHPRAVGLDAGERRVQGLDLEPVDCDHRVTFVEQVVGQGVAGRAEARDQHLAAARRPRQEAAQLERVPAGQQAVDLEAPGQLQHILEDARLGLGNVDRVLLLIDAGLHAVVADAVAGAGDHGVVDHGDGERGDGVAVALDLVHLRDLFL